MEHESDGNTNCNWCDRYRIGIGTGGLGNKRKSGDNPNDSIVEIGQNTEKCPGDLKSFDVTRNLGRNHQLMLV